MILYRTYLEDYWSLVFVNLVQDACGGFADISCDDDEEVCALPAEEAAGAGAGGAAGDTAHYTASPRPPRHETLLWLSL